MNDGVYSIFIGVRPFAIAAVTGRSGLGLADVDLRVRAERVTALAIPVVSPPPPHGIRTASKSSRSSTSSSPIVPFPAMTGVVLDGMDEVAVDAVAEVALARRPSRPTTRPRDAHDPAAEALDCGELRHRRVVGTTIVAGMPSSRAIHATPCAMFPVLVVTTPSRSCVRRRAQDRVRRAAELEGADRLQVLELEPDLGGRVDLEPDERRADDGAGDSLAGALDLLERDQKSTSIPTPCSRARRTTSSADARSSTAIPSDLKTVSSSSCSRPGMHPGEHLAELGLDVLRADRSLAAAMM